MKFVIAPDSFKESMSAPLAAQAIERGVRAVFPAAECWLVPLADGGEGTTEALLAGLGGSPRQVTVSDPLGRPVEATYGLSGSLAIIEVAAAVGAGLIAPAERNILQADSSGVGELISAALDAGAERLLLGLGGSLTCDGGAGLLAQLGAVFCDADGSSLTPNPQALSRLARVDLAGLDPRLGRVRIDLASDVTNPLLGAEGAAAVFGPQKGASPEQVLVLEEVLQRLADCLVAAGAPDVRDRPGAGAAGGLGAAFLSLGAQLRSGATVVAEAVGLEELIQGADLVLTGEGSIDPQTRYGKVPWGVAEIARRHGVPVIAFAGRVAPDASVAAGFDAIVAMLREVSDLPAALAAGPVNLEAAVAATLRAYQLGRSSKAR